MARTALRYSPLLYSNSNVLTSRIEKKKKKKRKNQKKKTGINIKTTKHQYTETFVLREIYFVTKLVIFHRSFRVNLVLNWKKWIEVAAIFSTTLISLFSSGMGTYFTATSVSLVDKSRINCPNQNI